ncbi:MAG: small multi-drug export protein [Clostridia bacterium]|nr:small multi-drug export protein [Oscillospiraceae bacterium]MBR2410515.1 small multi-drug export protein [Clostridia bacterium]
MTEQIALWFESLFPSETSRELIAFIVSLFPVLECRGGMIIALAAGVEFLKAFVICYIGNMLPIPFILLFIKKIFAFMKKHGILTKIVLKLEGKTEKHKEKIDKYGHWALFTFVAIPLPGTGGWTGALIAALFNISFKKALPVIALGVLTANIIMSVVTYGAGAVFGF